MSLIANIISKFEIRKQAELTFAQKKQSRGGSEAQNSQQINLKPSGNIKTSIFISFLFLSLEALKQMVTHFFFIITHT